jgi:hypothetical protein
VQPCSMETQIPDFQFPDSMFPTFQVYNFSRGYSSNYSFRVSEFPGPLRGSAEGPQKPDSKCADSRILLCKFQIPSFRVSKAPLWVRGGTPISKFLVSWWADSRILIRKFQIPRFRDPSVQIPGYSLANSRFRVSEFPRPPLGSKPKGAPITPKEHHPQIPDSEFPSFRGPLFGPRQREHSQIPPNSKFRVSEFPSRPLLALGSQQEYSKRDSQIPSFRV